MAIRQLTNRQAEILSYIEKYYKENKKGPSVSNIMTFFNLFSKSTVHQHLEALVRKKYLKKTLNGSITLYDSNDDMKGHSKMIKIPLYGRIPASPATEVFPEEDFLEIPDYFVGQGDHFALRVKGDSMIDADINEGDLVFIKKQPTARSGQIVAARVNHTEVTLKQLKRKRGKIVLNPFNSSMEPIVIDDENFEIQGVMVGLYRKLMP